MRCYSNNQKNLEKGVDFQTQVMTLNSPMNVIEAQSLCSVNGTFLNANRKKVCFMERFMETPPLHIKFVHCFDFIYFQNEINIFLFLQG